MPVLQWLLLFLLSSIFYGWVLLENGAKWLEGWQSWWLIGWFSLDWTVKQIRLEPVHNLFNNKAMKARLVN